MRPYQQTGLDTKFGLSEAESEVLLLLLQGYTNDEIAEKRRIAVTTVKTQVRDIYDKFHIPVEKRATRAAIAQVIYAVLQFEFRGSLMAILGYSDYILEEVNNSPDSLYETTNRIRQRATDLFYLINQFDVMLFAEKRSPITGKPTFSLPELAKGWEEIARFLFLGSHKDFIFDCSSTPQDLLELPGSAYEAYTLGCCLLSAVLRSINSGYVKLLISLPSNNPTHWQMTIEYPNNPLMQKAWDIASGKLIPQVSDTTSFDISPLVKSASDLSQAQIIIQTLNGRIGLERESNNISCLTAHIPY